MNCAVRTGVPPRVTSVTVTMPRPLETSTRRPAAVATTSHVRVVAPASTTISTRSPLIRSTTPGAPGFIPVRRACAPQVEGYERCSAMTPRYQSKLDLGVRFCVS